MNRFADVQRDTLYWLWRFFDIRTVMQEPGTALVRTPLTALPSPNRCWLLNENGGEVQVTEVNGAAAVGIPYTWFGLPVSAPELAGRIGLTVQNRYDAIEWRDPTWDETADALRLILPPAGLLTAAAPRQ